MLAPTLLTAALQPAVVIEKTEYPAGNNGVVDYPAGYELKTSEGTLATDPCTFELVAAGDLITIRAGKVWKVYPYHV